MKVELLPGAPDTPCECSRYAEDEVRGANRHGHTTGYVQLTLTKPMLAIGEALVLPTMEDEARMRHIDPADPNWGWRG